MTARTSRQQWLRRVVVVALVAGFCGSGSVPASGIADRENAHRAEVDAAVTKQLADHGRASVWVVLKDTADLTPARSLRTKTDKSVFVHKTLTREADRSQAGLRDLLRRRNMRFTPFWITNAIQ